MENKNVNGTNNDFDDLESVVICGMGAANTKTTDRPDLCNDVKYKHVEINRDSHTKHVDIIDRTRERNLESKQRHSEETENCDGDENGDLTEIMTNDQNMKSTIGVKTMVKTLSVGNNVPFTLSNKERVTDKILSRGGNVVGKYGNAWDTCVEEQRRVDFDREVSGMISIDDPVTPADRVIIKNMVPNKDEIPCSLDTKGEKIPLSNVKEKKIKLRKKLVRKIMEPLHLLVNHLLEYEGKLMRYIDTIT